METNPRTSNFWERNSDALMVGVILIVIGLFIEYKTGWFVKTNTPVTVSPTPTIFPVTATPAKTIVPTPYPVFKDETSAVDPIVSEPHTIANPRNDFVRSLTPDFILPISLVLIFVLAILREIRAHYRHRQERLEAELNKTRSELVRKRRVSRREEEKEKRRKMIRQNRDKREYDKIQVESWITLAIFVFILIVMISFMIN